MTMTPRKKVAKQPITKKAHPERPDYYPYVDTVVTTSKAVVVDSDSQVRWNASAEEFEIADRSGEPTWGVYSLDEVIRYKDMKTTLQLLIELIPD